MTITTPDPNNYRSKWVLKTYFVFSSQEERRSQACLGGPE